MPPTQIGPYRIVRPLGEGGMGAVYEALQEPIGRRVALKVLLPQNAQNRDALARFFNEARAVNMIEHPSIVQVSEFGQTPDGTAYLVMELLRGEPLSARLAALRGQGQCLPLSAALQLCAQIADALSAAHEKRIVHRDLKPGNVMLVRDPAVAGGERAKILDFGIAKLAQGQGQGTVTNAVMGTPQYMSPEQCRGAGGVDDKTDVYALGVMLYEMLAGRPPFMAETAIEYMGQHSFAEPPPLRSLAPAVPADAAAFVHRLLIKDKAARPVMAEAGAQLAQLMSRLSGVTQGAPTAVVKDPAAPSSEPLPRHAPSTLGGSLGQTLRPANRWRLSAPRLLALAGMGLVVTASSVVFRGWLRSPSAAPAFPAVPPAPVSRPATPAMLPLASPPASAVGAAVPESPPQVPSVLDKPQIPRPAPKPQPKAPQAAKPPQVPRPVLPVGPKPTSRPPFQPSRRTQPTAKLPEDYEP